MRAGRYTLSALALVVAAAGMTVSGTAQAEKVYKWVDEAGVTHYGEKAPKEAAATKVKVSDTTSSDADDEIDRLQKNRQAARAAKEEGEEEGTPAGVTPPAAGTGEANNKACEQNRKNLETLKSGRRVRAVDESGKPRTLNADEMKAQLEFAESELRRCEQLQKIKEAGKGKAEGY